MGYFKLPLTGCFHKFEMNGSECIQCGLTKSEILKKKNTLICTHQNDGCDFCGGVGGWIGFNEENASKEIIECKECKRKE